MPFYLISTVKCITISALSMESTQAVNPNQLKLQNIHPMSSVRQTVVC